MVGLSSPRWSNSRENPYDPKWSGVKRRPRPLLWSWVKDLGIGQEIS
jgi:hypothetical protein